MEVPGVLDEERPLLGVEHLEPLVDSHLRLVRLHLAEVGIDRSVERDGIADHGLQIDTHALVVRGPEAGHGPVEEARPGEGAVRDGLHVAAGRDVAEPVEGRELRHQARHPLGDVGPIGLFVVTADEASQGNAPGLRRRVGEAEAPERDRDPDHVAVPGQPPLRFPHGVEAEVVALPLRPDAVELHPQGVRLEDVGTLLVVERVQQHRDAVVDVDLLAFVETHSHLGRVVLAHEDDV